MVMDNLVRILGVRLPIVQAPMAGGPDTPELAAAVSNAGGLGSLGCAYATAAQIDALTAAVRRLTSQPLGLNLFIRAGEPGPVDDGGPDRGRARPGSAGQAPVDAARVSTVLRPFRRALGLPDEPPPALAPPSFEAQLEAVLRAGPRVFSFTFGMPTREHVAALRARSILVVGTATTVEEGEALDALGVDAICAQGSEAGGHRGTFLGRFDDALVGTMALVPQMARRTRVPVIAAGGIMDGGAIRAALALGAQGVQLGTAFLTCPEAGTSAPHRAALASEAARRTVVTRAFSGRAARGIRNAMTDAFEGVEALPFPQQQEMTRDMRAAAVARERTDLMQMWAGQGAPLIRALPAGELVETLAREAGL
jgi:nitronate monooxygenase